MLTNHDMLLHAAAAVLGDMAASGAGGASGANSDSSNGSNDSSGGECAYNEASGGTGGMSNVTSLSNSTDASNVGSPYTTPAFGAQASGTLDPSSSPPVRSAPPPSPQSFMRITQMVPQAAQAPHAQQASHARLAAHTNRATLAMMRASPPTLTGAQVNTTVTRGSPPAKTPPTRTPVRARSPASTRFSGGGMRRNNSVLSANDVWTDDMEARAVKWRNTLLGLAWKHTETMKWYRKVLTVSFTVAQVVTGLTKVSMFSSLANNITTSAASDDSPSTVTLGVQIPALDIAVKCITFGVGLYESIQTIVLKSLSYEDAVSGHEQRAQHFQRLADEIDTMLSTSKSARITYTRFVDKMKTSFQKLPSMHHEIPDWVHRRFERFGVQHSIEDTVNLMNGPIF
jgi:hypothetical protein